jgi:hypothetical protein
MAFRTGLVLGCLLPFAAVGLLGCAVVDQYSGRAVVYNIEAEHAQEQALLLNIVRAYLRRPMQFTTVSSITGSASASGSVQYTTPVHVPFRPITNGTSIAGFPTLPSWTLNGSMSGGPTFTVPVLDTQEFYQGLLTPVPAQIWDLYIQNSYPRDLLFNLLVQKMVIRRAGTADCPPSNHERQCELVLQNYVGEDAEIELFQIFSDYLLAYGLTTEPDKKPDAPFPLKGAYNVNLKMLGPAAGSSESSGSQGSASSSSSSGGSGPKPYALCFAPRDPGMRGCVLPNSLCGVPQKSAKLRPKNDPRPGGVCRSPDVQKANSELVSSRNIATTNAPESIKLVGIIMPAFIVDRMQESLSQIIQRIEPELGRNEDLRRLGSDLNFFKDSPVLVSVSTRSVEGIIYYLGELSRRRLNPEFEGTSRTIYFTYPARYATYPIGKCIHVDPDHPLKPNGRDLCEPIFVLDANALPEPGTFVSTVYEGTLYSVPTARTYSGPVLDIVKQALALSSSAKSLPQSNVISVVGQ